MIYEIKPNDFNPIFEVSGCFLEHKGEILLLHRLENKSDGNMWGLPAGKLENGETPIDAVQREMIEEINCSIHKKDISYFKKVHVRYPEKDITFHMFHIKLNNKLSIQINPEEHKDYGWFTIENALQINLMRYMDDCIKLFQKKETSFKDKIMI